jgi:hypothetical protein
VHQVMLQWLEVDDIDGLVAFARSALSQLKGRVAHRLSGGKARAFLDYYAQSQDREVGGSAILGECCCFLQRRDYRSREPRRRVFRRATPQGPLRALRRAFGRGDSREDGRGVITLQRG